MVERYFYDTASKGRSVVGQLDTSTSNPKTVQLHEFTKHYRPNWFLRQFAGFTKVPKATVVAVNELTLTARKGEICVLLGANGSGKSITLDASVGLNTVTSGAIKAIDLDRGITARARTHSGGQKRKPSWE
jgi:ABC-type multidrug transport system ATPase subunit